MYDGLLSDIQSGKYRPGDQLPGEHTLAKQYHVSRNTLRQAILLLHEDGCVSIQKARGTFVLQSPAPRQECLEQLSNPLRSMAIQPIDDVEFRVDIRQMSPKSQQLFGLDASRVLVLMEHLYRVQGRCVGYGMSFVPYDRLLSQEIPLNDMGRISEFYDQLTGQQGVYASSTLRLVTPRPLVTRLMGVSAEYTLFMLEEELFDSASQVVMTQKLFFVPDAYELRIRRRNERRSGANGWEQA